jgi:hypothetical protein
MTKRTTEIASAGKYRTSHLTGVIQQGQFTQAEPHFYTLFISIPGNAPERFNTIYS